MLLYAVKSKSGSLVVQLDFKALYDVGFSNPYHLTEIVSDG